MATKPSTKQLVNRAALPMIGSLANGTLDTTLGSIDSELAKLFEDRNALLTDGGLITYTGTTVLFSESLKLSINSKVAGGAPTVIDLGATTRTISASGRMIYAVINRTGGTAVITDDSATLPAQVAANQEVYLIAKRVDAGDGTKRLYFRNGTTLNEGQTSRLGAAGSGSGSGAGINYIGNPDAEGGTTGWLTYADAAQALPVDGTGGSPNITWTQTPTNPLRGTNSFLFTKDAANRQGQGVAYDFEIDNADLGKVLSISFDYAVNSGTYATGDLTVYIYDVTNAVVIQPSGYQIENAAIGLSVKQIASFQTAVNSNQYRLILHVASTSASAYTLKIDNVLAGPQFVSNGTPITDWVQYTPTIVGFGSPTNVSFFSRRVGANLEIQGMFTSGISTGVTASVTIGFSGGNGNVSNKSGILPSGNYSNVGGWTNTGATSGETAVIALPNETVFYFGHAQTPTTASGTPMLGNAVVSVGQIVSVRASIPINGWSSNVQMSNDTDTRVVAARYSTNTTATLVNGTIIDFEDKTFDTHNAVTTGGSWKFTAPINGIYDVKARLGFSSVTPSVIGQRILIDVYVNGSRVAIIGSDNPEETTASREFFCEGSTLVELKAGDELHFQFNSLAAYTTQLNGSSDHNYACISRLSGPSLIAATETIAARYTSTAGTSIANGSVTTILHENKSLDTHGAYNPLTGIFTAPASGKYQVNFAICYQNFLVGTSFHIRMRLMKNGNTYTFIEIPMPDGVNEDMSIVGSDIVELIAGDQLLINTDHNSGGSRNLTTGTGKTYFSLHRIGQ